MPATLDRLLADLEFAKNNFGPGAAGKIKRLLHRLSKREFRTPHQLIRFHEALLFLRAFPQSAGLIRPLEEVLDTFHDLVEKLGAHGADMSAFDDFDTSGIAGTTMQDALNFEAARWLARRIPNNVEVAWDDYDDERAMGLVWPRFIPLLEEDSDVEANIPWRLWLNAARGHERDLPWLIQQFERLQQRHGRPAVELYNALRLPLRWHLKNLKLSRTRNWSRPRRFFFHTDLLISRKEVSLAMELGRPAPPLTPLSRRQGETIIETIREVMLVRYRELYGTTLGDPRSVVQADVGRGVVIYLWNLAAERRLPLRAYVAGFAVKNGVPINYIESIGLCEWIEVGFNTFYSYRQGETAWIYAQALRCLCALTGARTISVYPYQIGQNNDEALDSGAFWFYRKLGLRSGNPALEQLARNEEKKIAANQRYRTSRRVLRQLAEGHVFYELDRKPKVEGLSGSPRKDTGEAFRGSWDTFSTRNLGLLVNRRMAREFQGNAKQMRDATAAQVSKVLGANASRWTAAERHCLENWSLILALVPELTTWAADEKQRMVAIIRAQAGANEMRYLRLTQRHARLREGLLRLGSL